MRVFVRDEMDKSAADIRSQLGRAADDLQADDHAGWPGGAARGAAPDHERDRRKTRLRVDLGETNERIAEPRANIRRRLGAVSGLSVELRLYFLTHRVNAW
jgi:hypothetical protein